MTHDKSHENCDLRLLVWPFGSSQRRESGSAFFRVNAGSVQDRGCILIGSRVPLRKACVFQPSSKSQTRLAKSTACVNGSTRVCETPLTRTQLLLPKRTAELHSNPRNSPLRPANPAYLAADEGSVCPGGTDGKGYRGADCILYILTYVLRFSVGTGLVRAGKGLSTARY